MCYSRIIELIISLLRCAVIENENFPVFGLYDFPVAVCGIAGIFAIGMSVLAIAETEPARRRSGCRLLAEHLEGRAREGVDAVWLRPGVVDGLRVVPPQEKLEEIRRRLVREDLPGKLGTLRTQFVWSHGPVDARLAFVGEAPGAEEEKRGYPFAGPAGDLLDKAISAMELLRSDLYITNIVKYRPKMDGEQGSANRKPSPEEIAASMPFLEEELRLVRPDVVVALGLTAHAGLTGEADARLATARGKFRDWHGMALMTTCHPSYLLRNPALEEKRRFWEDLLLVMERMGLPVSDRQRGYFMKK